jgi:hypothetical protein
MLLTTRQLAILCLVCMAAGYWLSSPINSTPAKERPVLRWIAKAAKNFLWIALVVEPPPKEQLVQQRVGNDGFPMLDHGRSF